MYLLFRQPWIVGEQISRIPEGSLQVTAASVLGHRHGLYYPRLQPEWV
jgi:hypothetical protein